VGPILRRAAAPPELLLGPGLLLLVLGLRMLLAGLRLLLPGRRLLLLLVLCRLHGCWTSSGGALH
jgi:hypothetical protein